ncbi:MAG TPA: hypothetical protein VJG30_00300 [Candidatus Nanoarchaeia archaeon]|nr:hypothetical protein [Candidatus Nanoarchaeia archaeon]
MRQMKVNINRKHFRRHIKKVKHAKWLLPGWVFYEFYKMSKEKGESNRKSFSQGAKAEIIRLATTASIPIPGTYELTTTGLALLKNKIVKGEVKDLTFNSLKHFKPLKSINKKELIKGVHFKIYKKNGKNYLRIY